MKHNPDRGHQAQGVRGRINARTGESTKKR